MQCKQQQPLSHFPYNQSKTKAYTLIPKSKFGIYLFTFNAYTELFC